MFGCKVGKLPIAYLGLPMSNCKMSKTQLSYTVDEASRRLGNWKCDTMSSGGKVTLLSRCLSSTPMYTMGMCQLYEGSNEAFDSVRSRFHW